MTEHSQMIVNISEIEDAARKLSGLAHHTPILTSRTFSELCDCSLFLKAENMQRTGSFKVRGAGYKIANLTSAERTRGVIASSAGNHAQGVAVAARVANIRATVVMPETAALAKITATQGYGAEVVLHGLSYDEAYHYALDLASERKAVFVHAFDDPWIMAGQGTVGLEIMDDLPDVDAVVVPVGGGGLIAGIAVALKEKRRDVRVLGVQAAGADSAFRSFRAGSALCSETVRTIADGIAIRCCGALTLDYMLRYVDDIITVEDEAISHAMVMLLERSKVVVEAAGAVGLAALLAGRLSLHGKKVAVVLSGGNVDINVLARLIEHGLTNAGRYLIIRTSLVDQPGELHRLTDVLARLRVNIIQIEHHRTGVRLPVSQTEVELTLEARDPKHGEEIIQALAGSGYDVKRVV